VYLTYLAEPFNVYGAIIAIALFAIGYFRPVHESLIASLIVLSVYGLWTLYRFWFASPAFEIGWNELIWLLLFPYFALAGGINNRDGSAVADPLAFLYPHQHHEWASSDAMLVVDERFSFLSSTAFLYQLEEEVLRALREKRGFHLLLVQVVNLDKVSRYVGRQHAEVLLNLVAEHLQQHCSGPKAQVGNQVLGGIIPGDELQIAESVQRKMEDQFYELMHTRPRRETQMKLKLRFGLATCPSDGIEADALLDKAKHELLWGRMQSKEDEFR
jgi:GGDEF domain-containing protein